MATIRIAERVGLLGGSVDEAAGVLRNAVICGLESANKRRYPRAVLERDHKKYEAAKVFFGHDTGDRPFRDWIGLVENVRPGTDGRPRGDLRLFKSDPNAGKLLEAARVCPGRFGLSHVVEAKCRREHGIEIIEAIERVESVDVVLSPATNAGGLFESTGMSSHTSDAHSHSETAHAATASDHPAAKHSAAAHAASSEATRHAAAGNHVAAAAAHHQAANHHDKATAAHLARDGNRGGADMHHSRASVSHRKAARSLLGESKGSVPVDGKRFAEAIRGGSFFQEPPGDVPTDGVRFAEVLRGTPFLTEDGTVPTDGKLFAASIRE